MPGLTGRRSLAHWLLAVADELGLDVSVRSSMQHLKRCRSAHCEGGCPRPHTEPWLTFASKQAGRQEPRTVKPERRASHTGAVPCGKPEPAMSIHTLCTPRPSVHAADRRATVLNLDTFLKGQVVGAEFFKENHFTHGMLTLVDRAFRHLGGAGAGSSVFLLSQAMGGGKTHSMVALGLLAQDPALRSKVLTGDQNPAPPTRPVPRGRLQRPKHRRPGRDLGLHRRAAGQG